MDKPVYQVDLSQEDVVTIHKALRWFAEKETNKSYEPDVYQAAKAQNLALIGDVRRQGGKIHLGEVDLSASEIGYIRMCLVEYGRAHTNRLGKMGPHIEEEFHAHVGDLARRLDAAIDPFLERAYTLGVMTMAEIAERLDLSYDSLVKAAREGRVQARQSGSTWLSTTSAVERAIQAGTLRPRNKTTE